MLLSIVIPVYKVEEYIKRTLDSIYTQHFDENCYEVIVVDDGTPDNSMQVVEQFVPAHANLRIIHQENQGLSAARNTGLEAAKGDFVWFIDSDDTITEQSLQIVRNAIEELPGCDFYGFSIAIVRQSGTVVNRCVSSPKVHDPYNRAISYRELQTYLFINGTRFIYSRDFLNRHALHFWKGMRHEDMDFMIRALFLAEKICLREEVTYNYLVREGSIMQTINMKSFNDLLTIAHSMEQMKQERAKTKSEQAYFDRWLWRLVSIVLAAHMFSTTPSAEYLAFVENNNTFFRKVARKSLPLHLAGGDWKDLVMSLLVVMKPIWLNRVFSFYQRKKA